MATTKRRKKLKRTKTKGAPPKKKRRAKKAPAKKDGFPTLREMREARDEYAAEYGSKILTQARMKELPKAMGLRASADFIDAVAKKVYLDVFKAAKRCVSNDRKTLRPDDL